GGGGWGGGRGGAHGWRVEGGAGGAGRGGGGGGGGVRARRGRDPLDRPHQAGRAAARPLAEVLRVPPADDRGLPALRPAPEDRGVRRGPGRGRGQLLLPAGRHLRPPAAPAPPPPPPRAPPPPAPPPKPFPLPRVDPARPP